MVVVVSTGPRTLDGRAKDQRGPEATARRHRARDARTALANQPAPGRQGSGAEQVRRASGQRFVGPLDSGGRPGGSYLLAVCSRPKPVSVSGFVKRCDLDIRMALKHPTGQGEVAARGPQTGPRGHVSVLAVEQQNRVRR
jgi:hypothetical protein